MTTGGYRLRYTTAWKIQGSSGLVSPGEYELLKISNPEVKVVLTSDLEAWSEHIDRWNALANLVLHGGLANSPEKAQLRKEELEGVRKARRASHSEGVFLVLDGSRPAKPDLAVLRTVDDVRVSLGAFSTEAVKQEFRHYLAGAAAATMSVMPSKSNCRAEPIAGACYLEDGSTAGVIYNFDILSGSPTLSIIEKMSADLVPEVARRASALVQHETLTKVARLLLSAMTEKDVTGRFLRAWTALEMFVHSTFKDRYETTARAERATPGSALGNVMLPYLREGNDAFPVAAKFAAISFSLLGPNLLPEMKEFNELKADRDAYTHTGANFDLDDRARRCQNLLLKFLGAELHARAEVKMGRQKTSLNSPPS